MGGLAEVVPHSQGLPALPQAGRTAWLCPRVEVEEPLLLLLLWPQSMSKLSPAVLGDRNSPSPGPGSPAQAVADGAQVQVNISCMPSTGLALPLPTPFPHGTPQLSLHSHCQGRMSVDGDSSCPLPRRGHPGWFPGTGREESGPGMCVPGEWREGHAGVPALWHWLTCSGG